MADVEVDYQSVQTVTGLLNNAVQSIVPQLQLLQTQVDGLLTQDGGLWMTSTSPVLLSSYQTFNASLTNAVNGISNFAQQFTSIAGQIKSMDTQMATSLSSGS